MDNQNDFEKVFFSSLAETPAIPECYPAIMSKINKKNYVKKTFMAMAATMLIATTAFIYFANPTKNTLPSEEVEYLQNINSHINGDDVKQELVSYSLIDEAMY
jgi:hypothetical protein